MGRNQVVLNTWSAQRGLQLFESGDDALIQISPLHYRVRKESGRGYWDVKGDGWRWTCSCPEFQERSQLCAHLWAIELATKIRAAREKAMPQGVEVVTVPDAPICPGGDTHKVVRNGFRGCRKGSVQRYRCRTCGKQFVIDHGFARIHSDPLFVAAAVDLKRKGNSYREIADHFREYWALPVTKSTIERWVRKVFRLLAFWDKNSGPTVGGTWHIDETLTNVDGRLDYVWNLLDHLTRYWLASCVSEGRKVEDARKPLREGREVAGDIPAFLVSDGYPGYEEACRKELYTSNKFAVHLVNPPIRRIASDAQNEVHPGNNIVERLQQELRATTKRMRGFDSLETAQETIDGIRALHNHILPHPALRGMTPAQAAGVPTPVLAHEGRLMAVLAAAHLLQAKVTAKSDSTAQDTAS